MIARWQMRPIEPHEISGSDLREEIRQLRTLNTAFECYALTFWDEHGHEHAERAGLLFVPEAGRGGIAWGADASWTDADTAEEVVEQYARGEMNE